MSLTFVHIAIDPGSNATSAMREIKTGVGSYFKIDMFEKKRSIQGKRNQYKIAFQIIPV